METKFQFCKSWIRGYGFDLQPHVFPTLYYAASLCGALIDSVELKIYASIAYCLEK